MIFPKAGTRREADRADAHLDKADNGKGDWRLVTGQGDFSGKRKEDSPSLEGLKIGGRYQFTCLEEIEESQSGPDFFQRGPRVAPIKKPCRLTMARL